MVWVYLSPHFDDIALSCGGLVWEQANAGAEVEIWTLCAAIPASEGPFSAFAEELHVRWGAGPESALLRKQEDLASCQALNARPRHLDWLDCIYRRDDQGNFLYPTWEIVQQSIHPAENPRIEQLAESWQQSIPAGAQVVSPLALGNHVDHQLTRKAAERFSQDRGLQLWYYADYPYALKDQTLLANLRQPGSGWQFEHFPISPAGLTAWQNSIAAHASQITTFWMDLAEMRQSIHAYSRAFSVENPTVTLYRCV